MISPLNKWFFKQVIYPSVCQLWSGKQWIAFRRYHTSDASGFIRAVWLCVPAGCPDWLIHCCDYPPVHSNVCLTHFAQCFCSKWTQSEPGKLKFCCCCCSVKQESNKKEKPCCHTKKSNQLKYSKYPFSHCYNHFLCQRAAATMRHDNWTLSAYLIRIHLRPQRSFPLIALHHV